MAKIYTKRGDKGRSSLFGGQSVAKNDPRLDAYGTLDELNSILGLVQCELSSAKTSALLDDLSIIQNYIFNVGSHLACANKEMRSHLPPLNAAQVTHLETRIDAMESTLPELKNFILPGGTKAGAYFHLARTVCRRAERAVVTLSGEADPQVVIYLNRLSDYFFVAARFANQQQGVADIAWDKAKAP